MTGTPIVGRIADFIASDLTVVIPAHDAADTLADTLGSIDAQTAGAPRVIVVDDRSTDDTAAIARRHGNGIRVVSSPVPGPGGARNHGVSLVDTALLAFCDSDDVWTADRLAGDLRAFSTDPDVAILLGRSRYHADDPELLDGHHFDEQSDADVGPADHALIPHFGAATMRTTAFQQVGPIDHELGNFEDYEWFYRARDLGVRLVVHDRVVQTRRLRANSTSHQHPASPADLLAVIRRSVTRRRASGISDASRLDQLGDR